MWNTLELISIFYLVSPMYTIVYCVIVILNVQHKNVPRNKLYKMKHILNGVWPNLYGFKVGVYLHITTQYG